MVPAPDRTNFPTVQVYLATARPIQLAEQERDKRAKARGKGKAEEYDPFAEEYRAWLGENREMHLILAIRVDKTTPYSDSKELKDLENSVMRVGRKKILMTGYFPPTVRDPYLRMAFPRQVELSDKKVGFDLYIPGVSGPFRLVEFKLEPMVLAGKLEL